MCRIAGIISASNMNLERDIIRMRDVMQRGGPDDAGIFVDENLGIAFGHRRLSLIDLSSDGHQPMKSEDESYIIIYNGEIYNFKEIKEELNALGYNFNSKSDTEVILKGFIYWGNKIFEKLNGMFALAIFNKNTGDVILARDSSGIKPLYIYQNNDELIFASEIRSFHALREFEESKDWKIYFLAFGFLPEPITTLKDVKQLEKGTILCYNSKTKRSKVEKFNSFTFSNKISNTEEAIQKVKSVLNASVERHLISDAPIGLFLSGGIDSSLLTLLAAPLLKENLVTLSIDFDETKFSEKKYQDIIIGLTHTKHLTFKVTKEDFLFAYEDILKAMDQPSVDGINSYFISKYAKEAGLKAVLSGLGADELFGGYNSFVNINKYAWANYLPSFFFKLASLFKKDKYKKASYLSMKNIIGLFLFNRGLHAPSEISKILGIKENLIWQKLNDLNKHYQEGNELKGFNKASWIETNLYMQNQLLRDSDYMSMWHSLEIRVPFLDKELINLVCQISPETKFTQKRKKFLLIEPFNDLLPKAIWDRPKMGFTFPFESWLKDILDKENRMEKWQLDKFKNKEYSWSRIFVIYLSKIYK